MIATQASPALGHTHNMDAAVQVSRFPDPRARPGGVAWATRKSPTTQETTQAPPSLARRQPRIIAQP